jgi:dTDP-4-dehydrorhamnose reductase
METACRADRDGRERYSRFRRLSFCFDGGDDFSGRAGDIFHVAGGDPLAAFAYSVAGGDTGATGCVAIMKVLVLGSKGRLGGALARMWAPDYEVRGLARPELDVADPSALGKLLKPESYDLLVNCTGLTNVDRCERDREEAEVVNARAPGVMAQDAAAKGSRFIHFSTDYVFDGAKTTPYTEDDEAHPLSHYGRTKLEGERAALAPSARHMAVRVAWVFGPDKPSFVDQIIERALANDRVEAIANKTSCMTFTEDVSCWLRPFLDGDLPGGIYHMCNTGGCSWHEYGQFALDFAARTGLPLKARKVEPISLSDLKAFVAPRPPHTEVSTAKFTAVTGMAPRRWQEAVEEYLGRKLIRLR